MRTFHWVALIGAIAAAVIACSSEDDSNDPIGPGKGGSAGGVVGKGGSAGSTSKGGSSNNGGTTNNGGATNEGGATNNGGATNQGGSAGSGTCDPNTQSSSDTCNTCFQDACGTEAQACQGVAACGQIFSCLQSCGQGDSACETKCFTDNADGQQPAFAYLGCAYATCHDDCFCPGSCIFGSEGSCNTCLTSKCGTQCNGCDMNNDCMAMIMCFQYMGCYDLTSTTEQSACMDGCAQKFQNGVTPFNDFGTCADTNCTTDCQ